MCPMDLSLRVRWTVFVDCALFLASIVHFTLVYRSSDEVSRPGLERLGSLLMPLVVAYTRAT
jgi:hypothetical protein